MHATEDPPRIDLAVSGTEEHRWASMIAALPELRWPACDRVVVLAPHPDDETLGCGGLIATAAMRRLPILVVSVTDGEAAGPEADLAARRRHELEAALGQLSPGRPVPIERLGLPDGAVASHEATLERIVRATVADGDLVVCPLMDDGHPDHDACARAAARVAEVRGAALRMTPIWAWHWHDPSSTSISHGATLRLSATVRARKRRAIGCYSSQLDGAQPVVPGFMLRRLDRADEVLVRPGWSR